MNTSTSDETHADPHAAIGSAKKNAMLYQMIRRQLSQLANHPLSESPESLHSWSSGSPQRQDAEGNFATPASSSSPRRHAMADATASVSGVYDNMDVIEPRSSDSGIYSSTQERLEASGAVTEQTVPDVSAAADDPASELTLNDMVKMVSDMQAHSTEQAGTLDKLCKELDINDGGPSSYRLGRVMASLLDKLASVISSETNTPAAATSWEAVRSLLSTYQQQAQSSAEQLQQMLGPLHKFNTILASYEQRLEDLNRQADADRKKLRDATKAHKAAAARERLFRRSVMFMYKDNYALQANTRLLAANLSHSNTMGQQRFREVLETKRELEASTGIISQLLTDNTSLQQQVTEAGAQIIQLQTDLTHAHNQNVTTANAYTSAIQSRDNALAAKNAELQDVRTDKDAVIAKLQQQVAELQLQLKFDHMYTEEEAKAFGIVGS